MLLTCEQFHLLYDASSQPVLLVLDDRLAAHNPAAQLLLPPECTLDELCDAALLHASGLVSLQLGDECSLATCQPLDSGALLFLSSPTQEGDSAALGRAAYALSTPLTTLLSSSGSIFSLLGSSENPALRKTLSAANRACYQLLRLQENLNTFSAAQHGPLPLSLEKLDFCTLLDELHPIIDDACRMTGRSFVLDLPSVPLYLWADVRQLRRAVLALVSNSIKFTQPGAVLHLTLTRSGRRAVVRFRDSGDGIDPGILFSVFHRYRRPLTLEDPRFGSGFSLPVVQAIVQAHDGTLMLRSRENTGTDLVISLPTGAPKKQLLLRSPHVTIDRSGGFAPELVELSDVLPLDAFDRSGSV